jgi:hypothetical protein
VLLQAYAIKNVNTCKANKMAEKDLDYHMHK